MSEQKPQDYPDGCLPNSKIPKFTKANTEFVAALAARGTQDRAIFSRSEALRIRKAQSDVDAKRRTESAQLRREAESKDRAIVAECWTCWHSPRAGMITNRPNLCCPRPMVERQHPALLTYNDARLHVDAGHDVRPMREDRCSYCGRKMNGHRICVTCGRATGLDVRPVEGGSK